MSESNPMPASARSKRARKLMQQELLNNPGAMDDFEIKVGEMTLSTSEFIRPGIYTADDLTMQQRLFVEYYLRHGIQRRALRQSGIDPRETVYLLSNPVVKKIITQELQRLREETFAERLERKSILTQIARGKLGDYIKRDSMGNIVGIAADPDDDLTCLKEISITSKSGPSGDSETVKIKLDDRLKAIDLLNKMDGVYVSKVLLDDDFVFDLDVEDENL